MPVLAMKDYATMYYEIQGQGQPVIFIHGWSCSTETFAPIVNILKNDYMCISYDQRGHGCSSRPTKGLTLKQLGQDLRELIDYLGFDDVILVGHSMGGATIYSYIEQYGCDKLKKVVVLDMSPYITNTEDWKGGVVQGAYTMQDYWDDMETMGQDLTGFLWRFWRIVLPAFAALPAEMKDLVAPGLAGVNSAHTLTCLWHSMFHNDYRPIVKNITVPMLYMIPELGLYSMEAANYLKDNSGAEVEIDYFPGITHMITDEATEKAADDIRSFINK